jgi:histidinol dehydrogenase
MNYTIIENPDRSEWPELCQRPQQDDGSIRATVAQILSDVRENGDNALRRLGDQLDGKLTDSREIPADQLSTAAREIDLPLLAAIDLAFQNIDHFHRAQRQIPAHIETAPGVMCWRQSSPIERVGLYVPGGTAPLISTVLMLAIPAKIAGCREIILCTPGSDEKPVHPAIRFAAHLAGVHRLFQVGGAQAIAAMAYGTDTIPKVDKIFGPGNRYVTYAKQLVQLEGVAIDMPAGPSEVLIIADTNADPSFVAADLLSQAEHGPDSQVILLSTDSGMINKISDELDIQLSTLPRAGIARQALAQSRFIWFPHMQQALDFSNTYAPEHLIIATENPHQYISDVRSAGSVFLGNWTPESAGDYASGTNHTLPTAGYARAYSGVSLDSFVKNITFQQIAPHGITAIGPAIEELARAEQLDAHARSVSLRLKKINGASE